MFVPNFITLLKQSIGLQAGQQFYCSGFNSFSLPTSSVRLRNLYLLWVLLSTKVRFYIS